MPWDAVKMYSSRKTIQGKTEQENKKGEKKEIRSRGCIEVPSAAWLNIIFFIHYGAKNQLVHKRMSSS
jgi:hypothetical protein